MSKQAIKRLNECREKYGNDDPRTLVAFRARKAEVEAEEKPQFGVWFLMFSSEKDGESLGQVFIHAHSLSSAIRRTHEKGINPGGNVLSHQPTTNTAKIPEKWLDRLLSMEEIEQLALEMSL